MENAAIGCAMHTKVDSVFQTGKPRRILEADMTVLPEHTLSDSSNSDGSDFFILRPNNRIEIMQTGLYVFELNGTMHRDDHHDVRFEPFRYDGDKPDSLAQLGTARYEVNNSNASCSKLILAQQGQFFGFGFTNFGAQVDTPKAADVLATMTVRFHAEVTL